MAGLGLSVLGLAGCSDDKKSSVSAECKAAAKTTATGAPATRTVASDENGFSITVPVGWKDVIIDNAELQRLLNEGGESQLDDQIKAQVNTLLGRGGKLFAYDDCRRTTNLNLLKVAAAPGTTVAQIAEQLPAQLTKLKLSEVKVEPTKIAGGDAVKATGTQSVADRDVKLLQIQYYFLAGDQMYIAILATDDPGRDQPTLEAIGNSLNVVQASTTTTGK